MVSSGPLCRVHSAIAGAPVTGARFVTGGLNAANPGGNAGMDAGPEYSGAG